jgi:hypothetical protein
MTDKSEADSLIFLKYISDAFEEKREQLLFGFSDSAALKGRPMIAQGKAQRRPGFAFPKNSQALKGRHNSRFGLGDTSVRVLPGEWFPQVTNCR